MSATSSTLLQTTDHIDATTCLAIRREIFGAGDKVTQVVADALVRRNDAATSACPDWRALYVEALTDFVVRQQSPQGYVDEAQAAWLLQSVGKDRQIKVDSELELLIHVVETAEACPTSFYAAVLRLCVSHAVHGQTGPGVSDVDIARLKRVIYAGAGESGIAVSRAEAEALFDINDAVRGRTSCPAWRDLYVHAVASSILLAATHHNADAAEALKREQWLSQPAHLDFAAAFSGGVFATLQRALGPGAAEERRARLLSDDAAQIAAHQLDPDEWRWLTDRIGRDDDTDPNEQALIDFVLADSKTPPIVTGLAAKDDVIPHFGRRQAS
jgi:hypothetical protein